jgi:hypothetical protein
VITLVVALCVGSIHLQHLLPTWYRWHLAVRLGNRLRFPLTLIGRMGIDRAAYIGVVFPLWRSLSTPFEAIWVGCGDGRFCGGRQRVGPEPPAQADGDDVLPPKPDCRPVAWRVGKIWQAPGPGDAS